MSLTQQFNDFWTQYKPLLMKIGLTILLIPILIFGGGVIFTILGFFFSILLGFIVFILAIGVLLAVWGYADVKFGKFSTFKKPTSKTADEDKTITLNATDITDKTHENH